MTHSWLELWGAEAERGEGEGGEAERARGTRAKSHGAMRFWGRVLVVLAAPGAEPEPSFLCIQDIQLVPPLVRQNVALNPGRLAQLPYKHAVVVEHAEEVVKEVQAPSHEITSS